ncbi:heavy metal translocating P-type ATPase [Bythopirellula polymerisocia]|uniref:P-type Zn(2+) transporter n=1 Tax=Bythopirellula polymerisocia TaxID=2528003 RepID=A0A5C6CDS0_9BACT|nr:heavy metal translocating P-type ATPase [Bythopirellula polymerisocia]TWU22740.1 putative cadmium-transporting ATPase [Bythopirellula polymerisocia]
MEDPSNNSITKAPSADIRLRITGMDCAEEVTILKRELGPLVGNTDRLQFDIFNRKLTIREGMPHVSPTEMIAAVSETGMNAETWKDDPAEDSDEHDHASRSRTILTIISGAFGLSGLLAHAWLEGGFSNALGSEGMGLNTRVPLPAIALYVAGIIAGVWYVAPRAWHSAKRMMPDMNLLMFIAVCGAALIGEWFEAVTVSFLFSLSLLLESWSVGRARRAIAALMDLAPVTARVRDEQGNDYEVAPAEVAIGQLFYVRPGEKIPLDGNVQAGSSAVNQAPITGESAPVTKVPGDEVFAGTINGDGALEVACSKPANDTTLAHIIQLVEEAQSNRAPSEQWVEKFARYYTPTVMLLAALVMTVPPLLFGGEWSDWFYRSLVLLVIACPCALVISTPVSIVSALTAAARNGVLIKGGVFMEAPAHLKAIALDKTGTLTEGKPKVVDIVPFGEHDEEELLVRAASLESQSDHPLAKAIVEAASERKVQLLLVTDFQIIQGKGAQGVLNDNLFWIGSHRYLEERGQETPEVHQHLEAMQQAGRSVVVVGNENHVCGFITLSDTLRPTAKQTLQDLHATGIQHIVMLTGDNQGTAEAIATEAGIDEVHAELLPEDKVRLVSELVEKYDHVAMVGDGVNDAPALARASLGIAMGAAGSDAAIETADIALLADNLTKLPWLIRHSKNTLRIIHQNIGCSLTIKAIFMVLTFVGFASLWAAIAADMGASLVVIANGLRLLRDHD